jgi:hypothetical protein
VGYLAFAASAGDLIGHSIERPGDDRHCNCKQQPPTHSDGVPTLKTFEPRRAP